MRTAKIQSVSIRLVCPYPECGKIVTASTGKEQVIREDVASRWDDIAAHKQVCPHCHRAYWLPKNPFTIMETDGSLSPGYSNHE